MAVINLLCRNYQFHYFPAGLLLLRLHALWKRSTIILVLSTAVYISSYAVFATLTALDQTESFEFDCMYP